MGQRVGLMNMQLQYSEDTILNNGLFSMCYAAVFDSRINDKTTMLTLLGSNLKLLCATLTSNIVRFEDWNGYFGDEMSQPGSALFAKKKINPPRKKYNVFWKI